MTSMPPATPATATARRFEARSAPGNDSLAQNIPGNIVVERNTPCRNSYPQLAITEASISTTTHQ